MEKVKKEKAPVILSILTVFTLIALITVIIALITINVNNIYATIFGYKPIIVKTEEMEPALKFNGIAFAKTTEFKDLQNGNIVAYIKDNDFLISRIYYKDDNLVKLKTDSKENTEDIIIYKNDKNLKYKVAGVINNPMILLVVVIAVAALLVLFIFIVKKVKDFKLKRKNLSEKDKDNIDEPERIKVLIDKIDDITRQNVHKSQKVSKDFIQDIPKNIQYYNIEGYPEAKIIKEEISLPEIKLGEEIKIPELNLGEEKSVSEVKAKEEISLPEIKVGEEIKIPELNLEEEKSVSEVKAEEEISLPEIKVGEEIKIPELNLEEEKSVSEMKAEEEISLPEIKEEEETNIPEVRLEEKINIPEVELMEEKINISEIKLDKEKNVPEIELKEKEVNIPKIELKEEKNVQISNNQNIQKTHYKKIIPSSKKQAEKTLSAEKIDLDDIELNMTDINEFEKQIAIMKMDFEKNLFDYSDGNNDLMGTEQRLIDEHDGNYLEQ